MHANGWISGPADAATGECRGLLLRQARGTYITEPEQVNSTLLAAVQKLNVEVAFTMATETTKIILASTQSHQTELLLPNGYQVQIIGSLADIVSSSSSTVKKFQYAALIRDEGLLLVWHDQLDRILVHAAAVEAKLLALVCP